MLSMCVGTIQENWKVGVEHIYSNCFAEERYISLSGIGKTAQIKKGGGGNGKKASTTKIMNYLLNTTLPQPERSALSALHILHI